MKHLPRILSSLIVFCVVVLGLFYFFQAHIIFHPRPLPQGHIFTFAQRFDEGFFELSSGKKINYLVFEADAPRGTLLFFQGNAGSLAGWGNIAAQLSRTHSWDVWIADYPGYGKSEGPLPSDEEELHELAIKLFEQAEEISGGPIVAFGRSLGTGLASYLAVEKELDGLILETPYISISKVGKDMYPFLPESLARYELENQTALENQENIPILIFHGTDDKVIPFAHAETLAQLRNTIIFSRIENGGHNNLSRFPKYQAALRMFLSNIAGAK